MRTIAGALLVAAALGRCGCGEGSAPCDEDHPCPAGYRCDPDLHLCVRSDGGVRARDAASDAAAWLDTGPGEAVHADLSLHDAALDAALAFDTTSPPVDAAAADRAVVDAQAAERAPVDAGDLHGDAAVDAAVEAGGPDTASPDTSSPDIAPAVDATRPAITVTVTPRHGATAVDVHTTLQLDFSRAMDAPSVENGGLCLAPLDGACVGGSFAWLHAASAIFTPQAALAGSTVHVVTVRGACQAQDGDGFVGAGGEDCSAPDQCTRFVTSDGTAPGVASVVPANGATGVALRPVVTLTFSEAMDQASVVGHVRTGAGELSGAWSWVSASALRFTSSATLGCSTPVQVRVDEGARDPSGLALVDTCTSVAGAAFCSSFTTKPAHQECNDYQTGTCSDVLTYKEPCCGNCLGSVSVNCTNVGITYTVQCGTGCLTGCHYQRVYDTQQVCSQVCS